MSGQDRSGQDRAGQVRSGQRCDITAGQVEYIRCDAVTLHVVNVRYLSLLRLSKLFMTEFSMEYNTNSMSYIIMNININMKMNMKRNTNMNMSM